MRVGVCVLGGEFGYVSSRVRDVLEWCSGSSHW